MSSNTNVTQALGPTGPVEISATSNGYINVNASIAPSGEQNVNLNQVNGTAIGSGNPVPVTVENSISASNPSVSTTGTAVPADATFMGGVNAGDLLGIAVDSSGRLYVSVIGTLPAGTNSIGHVDVDNFPATQPVSGSVGVSNFPATQPVSGSVSVSNFPAETDQLGTPWDVAEEQTNAAISLTSPTPASGHMAYLTGIEVTAGPSTSSGNGDLSVGGMPNGPWLFIVIVPTGANFNGNVNQWEWTHARPASATATPISIALPALGSGTGRVSVVAHGYIL
ncbi:MAG: hypothetical protein ACRETA_04530 [Gammaproteobacteria bacterium]